MSAWAWYVVAFGAGFLCCLEWWQRCDRKLCDKLHGLIVESQQRSARFSEDLHTREQRR